MQKRMVFFSSEKTSLSQRAARAGTLALLLDLLLAAIIGWPTAGHAQSLSKQVTSQTTTLTSHHRTDVFINTANQALWHRWNDNGVWSNWEFVAGPSVGDVAVAMNPDGISMTLFIDDGANPGFLWRTYSPTLAQGQWGPWQDMPFVANYTASGVMKLTTGSDGTMYFVAGSIGSGGLTSFLRVLPPGGSWSDWINLGNAVPDGHLIETVPAIASSEPGRLDMVVIDNDDGGDPSIQGLGHLWYQSYSNGQASGWVNMFTYNAAPSRSGEGVAMTSVVPGRLELFATIFTAPGFLEHMTILTGSTSSGAQFNEWDQVSDGVSTNPLYSAGVVSGSDTFDVYWPDLLLEHKTYTNGVWSAWMSLGVPDNTSLSAMASPAVVGWMAPDPTPTPTPLPRPTPTPTSIPRCGPGSIFGKPCTVEP